MYKNAFFKGAQARRDGYPETSNPYSKKNEYRKWFNWLQGYVQGEEDLGYLDEDEEGGE